MSNMTVFRIGKLKSAVAIRASAAHNDRTRPCPNADPKGSIVLVKHPTGDTYQAVIDAIGDQTIRKNAVLAVEVLISASAEYFRPTGINEYGKFDEVKLNAWREATEKWIAENFPHAVSVALHLDEATPHYHVIDVPLVATLNKKTGLTIGKLKADAKYGDKKKLSEWQTKCADSVAHLGIERGVLRSPAKHQHIRQFYNAVNASLVPLPKVTTPMPIDEGWKTALLPMAYNAQIDKRNAEIDAVRDAKAKQYDKTIAKAINHDIVVKENAQLKAELAKAKQLTDAFKRDYKARLNDLRALPLPDVLNSVYGLVEHENSKPSYSSRQFRFDDSTIGITGDKWVFNSTGKGGKGALDLVMTIDGCDLATAANTLGNVFGVDSVAPLYVEKIVAACQSESGTKSVMASIAKSPKPMPMPDATKWPKVRTWLTKVRKMPQKMIDHLHLKGLVFADKFANAIFVREASGGFVRGTGASPFKQTIGTAVGGTFTIPPLELKTGEKRGLVLVEGPLDALAAYAMNPYDEVRAIGGNLIKLNTIDPKGLPVTTVFDRDEKGLQLTAQAREQWRCDYITVPKEYKDIAEMVASDPDWLHQIWRDGGGGETIDPANDGGSSNDGISVPQIPRPRPK